MTAKQPDLDTVIRSLAHHIAKVKPADRQAFLTMLGVLVANPENPEPVSFALTVYENYPRRMGKVLQFEPFLKARNARRGAAS